MLDGQMNIFDFLESAKEEGEGKNAWDYLLESVTHGTGFVNGKKRVNAIVLDSSLNEKEKISRIKSEYGQGGASYGYSKPYSCCGYEANIGCQYIVKWHGKGKEEEFSHEYSWKDVFTAISELIKKDEYIKETSKITDVA